MRDGLVVAPADGRVSLIAQALPPPELGLGDRPLTRVSIFMNVFDCHVNRARSRGRIEQIVYRPGTFLNAELDKASEDNERNALVIGTRARAASAWCRSPAWWRGASSASCKEGQAIGAGERFGLIRFGSRVDVYLPDGVEAAGLRGPDRGRRRDRDWPISGAGDRGLDLPRQLTIRNAAFSPRARRNGVSGPGACYI